MGYYGYPRATGDMDAWVGRSPENAACVVEALQEFGFGVEELSVALFLAEDTVVRMGYPPIRIEVLTSISGVEFAECYRERTVATLDGVEVSLISLSHLKANKRASGRPKDQDDLDNLP